MYKEKITLDKPLKSINYSEFLLNFLLLACKHLITLSAPLFFNGGSHLCLDVTYACVQH